MLMQTMLVLNNKTTRKRGEESKSQSTSNETQKVGTLGSQKRLFDMHETII